MKKVVFWGAGKHLKAFLDETKKMPEVFGNVQIILTDGDEKKWGHRIHGLHVHPPDDALKNYDGKIIIASTRFFEQIKRDIESRNISPERIKKADAYRRDEVIEYAFSRNAEFNANNIKKKYDSFDLDNMVVYTAIIGDYDELKQPKYIDEGVKYICFTDQDIDNPGIWEIVKIKRDGRSDQEIVKTYKMLPHRYFGEYNTSIWIDASFTIKRSLKELLRRYQRYADILMFPHEERICIYSEAAACIHWGYGAKSEILRQVNRYYNESIPENTGLFSGGFIARNHTLDHVTQIMNEWYEETMRSSYRDQISFAYIKYKKEFSVDLCDQNIFDNEYMDYQRHKHMRDAL